MNRRRAQQAAIAAGALAQLLPGAAHADVGASTAAAAATLSISEPARADLGSAATTAGSLNASLGPVSVTQSSTVGVLSGWTATVTASDFTATSGDQAVTLGAARLSYLAGASTTSGVALGNCTSSLTAQTLEMTRTAYRCGAALTVGTSVVSWQPTVKVTFPASTVAGRYSGTITHSVS